MAGLCLTRQIAFAAAACSRAGYVFAVCHGATQPATFDAALAKLWTGITTDDLPTIEAVCRPLMDVPESGADDTLDRDWMAWLTLATFEFPAALVSTRLPVQTLAQCSALMRTLMGEIDLRLGWRGLPMEGRLATLESTAQESCLAILGEDPSNPEVPVRELVAAGAAVARLVAASAADLAEATGWKLWPPAAPPDGGD